VHRSFACRTLVETYTRPKLKASNKETMMKTRFVALAVAATLGMGSVTAFAQDYHRRDEGRQSGWQHQREYRGGRQWADHQRYATPRYDPRSYGYRYDQRAYGYGHGHDNGDIAGALVLGAIAGAVVGQAASPYGYAQPPAAYYGTPAGYYGQPGYYAPSPGYASPGYGYGYYYGN
jgi:hypothetical protein